MKKLTKSIVTAIALAGMATAAQGWEPKRAVQLIVPFSPGGGSDINARLLVDAIRKNELSDANIIVKNMNGGTGAVGVTYLSTQPADGLTLVTYVSGQMMAAMTNNHEVTVENLTPIGTLALDTLVLAVKSDSEYKTFAELLDAAKSSPNTVTIGGTGRGGEDGLVFEALNADSGSALQYVPFEGGGQVLAALLGGHISAGIFNPSEVAAQAESGDARALGAFSSKRLGGIYADTPTFAELGFPEAKIETFRGYAGPADMDPEAVAYWEGVLEKVAETPEWKDYVAKNILIPSFMNSADSAAFWKEENVRYKKLLTASGLLQ
ncbi:MAG: tripartite tricarboxylate transporter substrate binding protein [Paracoccaceae bacterium]